MATLTIYDLDEATFAQLGKLAEAQGRSVEAEARSLLGYAVRRADTAETGEAWLAENRQALESANAYVERHGLPLQRHRKF